MEQSTDTTGLTTAIEELTLQIEALKDRIEELLPGPGAVASDAAKAARRFAHLLRGLELKPTVTLSAEATAHNVVHLSWTIDDENVSERKLWRCQGAGCEDFTEIATLHPGITSYDDTKLQRNTIYRYKLTVRPTKYLSDRIDDWLEDEWSALAEATTPS